MAQPNAELAVSTIESTDKAMSIDANFRGGDQGNWMHWVYEFMKRRRLSVRTRTRKGQITDAAMQSVKQGFCRRLMTSYNNTIANPRFFVNMDETAVYSNCSPNRTVHPKGEKTVSIMIGGTSSTRFTLAVSVATDGSKLPLFAIFKGVPSGRIDKSLADVLPSGLSGCVQRKGWMDNRTMAMWYDSVFKPYIAGNNGRSGLLLDHFKCHRSAEFIETIRADNAHPYMIPPHYTGILQPCDVGVNKPLKDRLKKKVSNWRSEKHASFEPGQLMPTPTRKEILCWLKEIWEQFPLEIVKNSFTGNGYFFEDTFDYSGDIESESDVES